VRKSSLPAGRVERRIVRPVDAAVLRRRRSRRSSGAPFAFTGGIPSDCIDGFSGAA